MYGCFFIGFFDFMFAGKSLIDFTSLFSPYDFKKNDNFHISSVLGHDLHTLMILGQQDFDFISNTQF